MRRSREAVDPVALVCLSLILACSGEDPGGVAADGAAFPNRRPTFPTGGRTLGYVANTLSDTISVIDLDAMTLLGNAPVGRDPVDVDGPTKVVVDRANGLAYVPLSYPASSSAGPHAAAFSSERASYVQALALDDFRPLGEVRVDPAASDLALSDDGGELAVSHADEILAQAKTGDDRRATVAFIAPPAGIADGTAALRQVTACVVPNALSYGPDRSRIYVACTGDDAVGVLDAQAGTVLDLVPAGNDQVNQPYALVASPDRTEMAVSNQVGRSMVLFSMTDAPAQMAVATFDGIPFFGAWLPGGQIIVPTQSPDGAAIIDAATGDVVTATSYGTDDCPAPREAQRTTDGRIFLVCEGDHFSPGLVVRVDPTTLAVQAQVSLGLFPNRMAVVEP